MGVATSRPNSVSLRLSSALILIPMTENITQTAKFTAKASVLIVSAEICSRLSPGLPAVDVVTLFLPWSCARRADSRVIQCPLHGLRLDRRQVRPTRTTAVVLSNYPAHRPFAARLCRPPGNARILRRRPESSGYAWTREITMSTVQSAATPLRSGPATRTSPTGGPKTTSSGSDRQADRLPQSRALGARAAVRLRGLGDVGNHHGADAEPRLSVHAGRSSSR